MIRLTSGLSSRSSTRLTSELPTNLVKNIGITLAGQLAFVYGELASNLPNLLKNTRLLEHILFYIVTYIQLLNIYILHWSLLKTVTLAFRPFSKEITKAYTLPAACHVPRRFGATAHLLTTSNPSGTILNLTLDRKVDH